VWGTPRGATAISPARQVTTSSPSWKVILAFGDVEGLVEVVLVERWPSAAAEVDDRDLAVRFFASEQDLRCVVHDQRLEGGLQPPPTAQRLRLPVPSGLLLPPAPTHDPVLESVPAVLIRPGAVSLHPSIDGDLRHGRQFHGFVLYLSWRSSSL
jgi:hypothetical protein